MNSAAMKNPLFLVVTSLVVAACGPGMGPGTDAASSEGPPCESADDCDGDQECCDDVCVDTQTNPDHCGGCGVDCSENDGFCASDSSCSALSWNALCANEEVIGLRDGQGPDDDTTDVLADAIASRCGIMGQSAGADDPNVIASDGRPMVVSGTTLAAGGGSFFQPVVGYVEDQGVTGVYFDQIDNGGTSRIVRRSDGAVLASVPSTTTGADEDWFVVYLVEVPNSGALLAAAHGFVANGTLAAGLWAQQNVLEDPSAFGDTWYVGRWADTDAIDGPTSTDSFEVIDSGR